LKATKRIQKFKGISSLKFRTDFKKIDKLMKKMKKKEGKSEGKR
jgi:hypothetical protein